MTKRLIDAISTRDNFQDNLAYMGSECKRILNIAPTVDAVEVKHGRWIYHECVSSHDGTVSGYSCSKCNGFVDEEIFDMDEFHKDFCGCCGAKMDEKGESDDA